MKKHIARECLLLLVVWNTSSGQPIQHIDSLFAPSLGRTMKCAFLLPSDYSSARRYPVLYLLHGNGGDHLQWISTSNITRYLEGFPFIIVMPDAGRSFYVNSLMEPQDRFEDYMMQDLPAYVQQTYSVDTTRQAIAGASMGGYGALVLALRHPQRFFFAADISGALDVPRYIELRAHDTALAFSYPDLCKIFGNGENAFRSEYDVFTLYKRSDPDMLPYIYLAMGIQDEYPLRLRMHRAFVDSLTARGIAYEYHETPGRHNAKYFDRAFLPLLQRLRDVLQHGHIPKD